MNNLAKASASGLSIQASNLNEAMKVAEMLARSQMVPKNYQGKPEDTLVSMMMGSELGLNPIQSLQNIAVINGKPSIYGDALLALVQNHPKFGGHEETFDDQTMTATCTVWRKGDKHKHTVTFSRADAEKAGLWGKQGPWQTYPKRMLMWRARGYALRDKFADALGGLITVEEARDMPAGEPEERNVTPPTEAPEALSYYPDADFSANFDKWAQVVESGKRTPEQIIAVVSSKGQLTEDQKEKIMALGECLEGAQA